MSMQPWGEEASAAWISNGTADPVGVRDGGMGRGVGVVVGLLKHATQYKMYPSVCVFAHNSRSATVRRWAQCCSASGRGDITVNYISLARNHR